MDASRTARAMWRLFVPLHAVTYFAEECAEGFTAAGLKGFWMDYFAGRAAPMGAVGPAVVGAGTATPGTSPPPRSSSGVGCTTTAPRRLRVPPGAGRSRS